MKLCDPAWDVARYAATCAALAYTTAGIDDLALITWLAAVSAIAFALGEHVFWKAA